MSSLSLSLDTQRFLINQSTKFLTAGGAVTLFGVGYDLYRPGKMPFLVRIVLLVAAVALVALSMLGVHYSVKEWRGKLEEMRRELEVLHAGLREQRDRL